MDTSYLAQQVTTIIGQLHGLFDDIGVPSHERESREAEVRIDEVYARAIADLCSCSLLCPRRSTTNCDRSPTRNMR